MNPSSPVTTSTKDHMSRFDDLKQAFLDCLEEAETVIDDLEKIVMQLEVQRNESRKQVLDLQTKLLEMAVGRVEGQLLTTEAPSAPEVVRPPEPLVSSVRTFVVAEDYGTFVCRDCKLVYERTKKRQILCDRCRKLSYDASQKRAQAAHQAKIAGQNPQPTR